MALLRCRIHFQDGNGPLTSFTNVSFEKFRQCHELWINLDGQQRQVAEKSKSVIQDVNDKSSAVHNFYYHKSCYSKFTNVTNIKRSQARCAKVMANRSVENQQDTIITEPPKKMLKSSMPSTSTTSQSTSTLLPACIICNKDEVYVTDTVSDHALHIFRAADIEYIAEHINVLSLEGGDITYQIVTLDVTYSVDYSNLNKQNKCTEELTNSQSLLTSLIVCGEAML